MRAGVTSGRRDGEVLEIPTNSWTKIMPEDGAGMATDETNIIYVQMPSKVFF